MPSSFSRPTDRQRSRPTVECPLQPGVCAWGRAAVRRLHPRWGMRPEPSRPDTIISTLYSRFRHELPLDLEHHPLELSYREGVVTLTGELESISAKRRAVRIAEQLPGVAAIDDRICVEPASAMEDGALRAHFRDAFTAERAFVEWALREHRQGQDELVRSPPRARGEVTVSVDDGVVTLEGTAPSHTHRRLAVVLAWWIPGSRNIVDHMVVSPPEQDSDEEITDAVHIVLEKDPILDAGQIIVSTSRGVVTLTGAVPSREQREMAEDDTWYVPGVHDVANALEVRR